MSIESGVPRGWVVQGFRLLCCEHDAAPRISVGCRGFFGSMGAKFAVKRTAARCIAPIAQSLAFGSLALSAAASATAGGKAQRGCAEDATRRTCREAQQTANQQTQTTMPCTPLCPTHVCLSRAATNRAERRRQPANTQSLKLERRGGRRSVFLPAPHERTRGSMDKHASAYIAQGRLGVCHFGAVLCLSAVPSRQKREGVEGMHRMEQKRACAIPCSLLIPFVYLLRACQCHRWTRRPQDVCLVCCTARVHDSKLQQQQCGWQNLQQSEQQ